MDKNNPVTGLKYVGFWMRLLATVIDIVILYAIILPLLISIYGWGYFESEESIQGLMDFLIKCVFPAAAAILLWIYKSATPGKMIISAKIMDANTGHSPSCVQSVIRYCAYLVSTVPLGLGFIWIAFDERKQSWHDKISKTVVVYSKKGPKD